jgi:hypothetical protein
MEKCGGVGQITDDIIRRMRIACWVPKATNIHSEYVILTAFPLENWLRYCPSVALLPLNVKLYVNNLAC